MSGLAAGRGEIDLAVGNVVGSNTANLSLVLGSTALVTSSFTTKGSSKLYPSPWKDRIEWK